MSHEFLNALAALITAIAWPVIAVVVVLLFRQRLESLVLPGGVEAKFRKVLEQEADAVIDAKHTDSKELAARQLEAAQRVEELAESKGAAFARQQMTAIAREYEVVRASMSPGDNRTREMEKIVTKMRTLGLASRDFLPEFMASPSPGTRLAAIAILQVLPAPDVEDWLSERFRTEQPFVQYHAGVALLVSARVLGAERTDQLRAAIAQARAYLGSDRQTTDRYNVLQDALDEVNRHGSKPN